MGKKRALEDADPDYDDYDDVSNQQDKRRKIMEESGKEATVRKIQDIVQKQFSEERSLKQMEISQIDEQLTEARSVLERLRACVVASYYNKLAQPTGTEPCIHPTVKKHLGKAPREGYEPMPSPQLPSDVPVTMATENRAHKPDRDNKVSSKVAESPKRGARFKSKKKIIVGNVSRFLPPEKRDENDQATHKWMMYVRGPLNKPDISDFVSKVWFFLHPSYRPNDLVEITKPPFHLTRRGWGEFPIRVQLYFHDGRNKKVDIIHSIKLDRTYTGLQTLGTETIVDIELERDVEDSLPIVVPVPRAISSTSTPPESSTTPAAPPPTPSTSSGTPSKPGWTHIQIKTEPTESGAGFQDITTLSSPQKEKEVERDDASPSLSGRDGEAVRIESKKMDTSDKANEESTPKSSRVQEASTSASITTKTLGSGSGTQKATTPEKPVYVKCVDSTGKMFLVPQHMLVKPDKSKGNTVKLQTSVAVSVNQQQKPQQQPITYVLSSSGPTTMTSASPTTASSSTTVLPPQILGAVQKIIKQQQEQQSLGNPAQSISTVIQTKGGANQQIIISPQNLTPSVSPRGTVSAQGSPQVVVSQRLPGKPGTLTAKVPGTLPVQRVLTAPVRGMTQTGIKKGQVVATAQGVRSPSQLLVRAQSGQMQVVHLIQGPQPPHGQGQSLVLQANPRAPATAQGQGQSLVLQANPRAPATGQSLVLQATPRAPAAAQGQGQSLVLQSNPRAPAAGQSLVLQANPRAGSPQSLILQASPRMSIGQSPLVLQASPRLSSTPGQSLILQASPRLPSTTQAASLVVQTPSTSTSSSLQGGPRMSSTPHGASILLQTAGPRASPSTSPGGMLVLRQGVSLLRPGAVVTSTPSPISTPTSAASTGGKKQVSLLTGKTLISTMDKTGAAAIAPPVSMATTETQMDGGSTDKKLLGGLPGAQNKSRPIVMKNNQREVLLAKVVPEDISLSHFENIEAIVQFVVRYHPLVGLNMDRSQHPYCAPNIETYTSWNVAKRRAMEAGEVTSPLISPAPPLPREGWKKVISGN